MAKVEVINVEGKKVKELTLNDSVFGIEPNMNVVHSVVLNYLANQRQGTQNTKTRAEVAGGGRKPWRQKGTGRARAGSSRSPIWVGGGITFGPQPRSYYKAMPRKARRLAVKSALSDKVNHSELFVIDELKLAAPKTKDVLNILNNFKVGDAKVLFITDGDVNVELSARNIQGVKALPYTNINIFDLLHHDKLFIAEGAIAKIEEVLG